MEENIKEQKSHSCLIAFIMIIIGSAIIGIVVFVCIKKASSQNDYNHDTPGILERHATMDDIVIIDETFNLSSLGEKITYKPNCDIKNLTFTFEFYNNKKTLQIVQKKVGGVNKNIEYSTTISLTDLNSDVIFGSSVKCRFYISSGTTSVFA